MSEDTQTNAFYKIGEVERLTGLSARRVRYYESRGLIAAARTSGNQRLYTPATVERLKLIRAMMEAGHSLSGIKAALEQRAAPRSKVAESEPEEAPPIRSLYPVRDEGALIDLLWRREGRNNKAD